MIYLSNKLRSIPIGANILPPIRQELFGSFVAWMPDSELYFSDVPSDAEEQVK